MTVRNKIIIRLLLVIFVLMGMLMAQGRIYKGPVDPAGDPRFKKEGYMDGNRIKAQFKNSTEMGNYGSDYCDAWPKGVTQNEYHDGMALVIVGKVYVTEDSIVVEDPSNYAGKIDTIYMCQTNFREGMEYSKDGTVRYGFHPIPGYVNLFAETPALSDDPESWPTEGWPCNVAIDTSDGVQDGKRFKGVWEGRYGIGSEAALETYFVVNDAQDLSNLEPGDKLKYYPRGDLKIGTYSADVTTQRGKPWGGLGLRVKQRMYQWDNPMAQDILFMEYTIANISDYDIPGIYFGYWIDNNIGGQNTGEDGRYDDIENIVYTWDTEGIGVDGYATGPMGHAFLETPGKGHNMIDDDGDGILDEKRDNEATEFIASQWGGIADPAAFESFYGYTPPVEGHWDADEDGDWKDGIDVNGDGTYIGEYAGDDVGIDGIGPGDPNYPGPDYGECNHKPDLGVEHSEPNFAWMDVNETDMIGLSTMIFRDNPDDGPDDPWFYNDKRIWSDMKSHARDTIGAGIGNLGELIGSGSFQLYQGNTEFFSVAELHSFDKATILNDGRKSGASFKDSAPILYTLKQTVDLIYEKDYRFVKPPERPTLTAQAGDGYVKLTWDNAAETLTREAFLNDNNDFEGYKLYRATEKDFNDAFKITDGYGTPIYRTPIFECDLKDGIEGFADYGERNGIQFYLGSDKGLAHSYVDYNVENGKTYYYALVAYDYGIHPDSLASSSENVVTSGEGQGIAPSANNIVVRTDKWEEIEFIGQNVAIVTPGTDASGKLITKNFEYQTDYAKFVDDHGYVDPVISTIDTAQLNNGHTYKIKFTSKKINQRLSLSGKLSDKRVYYHDMPTGIQVYDVTSGSLVYEDVSLNNEPVLYTTILDKHVESYKHFASDDTGEELYILPVDAEKETETFEGLQLKVKMNSLYAQVDREESGWIHGDAPIQVSFTDWESFVPGDYIIEFLPKDSTYWTVCTDVAAYNVALIDTTGFTLSPAEYLNPDELNVGFPFVVKHYVTPDSAELYDIVAWDVDGNGEFDMLNDKVLVGPYHGSKGLFGGFSYSYDYTFCCIDFTGDSESDLPQPGDIYKIVYDTPPTKNDSIVFTLKDVMKELDKDKLKSSMDSIRVVPNPYIATNNMEPAVINKFIGQNRRIMFTHIPEQCTIQIFSINGVLLRTIHAPEDQMVNFNGTGDHATGSIHWDLKTDEGLEVAAGMYLYHVEEKTTGREKMGKFAIIK